MRILITGGAGFIGSHTADALAKAGHEIVILDTLKPPVHNGKWPAYLSKKYTLIRGDAASPRDLLRALKGVDVVYALAAYQDLLPDFSTFYRTNTYGAALLLELIVTHKLPVKKIIFASSQFSYGDGRYRCRHNKKIFYPSFRPEAQLKKGVWSVVCSHGAPAQFLPMVEDQQLQPPNAYALSKEAKERLLFTLGKRYGIPVVGMRYSVVQGARQSPRNAYSGALRIFTTQALTGKDITVYEDGSQLRDFVHVHDVMAANLLVLKNSKANFQVFNVGGGKAYKVIDFARVVKKVVGGPSKVVVTGQYRWGDTRHAVSDVKKLRALGWRPTRTPADSVKEYVAWLKKDWKGNFDFSVSARARMQKLQVVRSAKRSH